MPLRSARGSSERETAENLVLLLDNASRYWRSIQPVMIRSHPEVYFPP